RVGIADDRLGQEEDFAVLWRPPVLTHTGLEGIVELLHVVDRLATDDDGFGVAGREVLPALRRASLDDDPAPLPRRRGVERPTRAIPGAFEVDRPYLRRIGKGVDTRVHDHRVGLPTRPELIAQLHVLVRPIVALVVVEQLLVAEVQRLLALIGRHDVPGNA